MNSLFYKWIAFAGLLAASFLGLGASARAEAPAAELVARIDESATLTAKRFATFEDANRLFQAMADQPDIAFGFVQDGCYARAHLMIERMRRLGFEPVRVWTFANGEDLHVKTNRHPKGFVQWWYHVAPALPVLSQGKIIYLVIDPSLFNRTVHLDDWVFAQRKSVSSPPPLVQVTKLGKPVYNPRLKTHVGTGYWPDRDPPEGAFRHAISTMRRYKGMEPG